MQGIKQTVKPPFTAFACQQKVTAWGLHIPTLSRRGRAGTRGGGRQAVSHSPQAGSVTSIFALISRREDGLPTLGSREGAVPTRQIRTLHTTQVPFRSAFFESRQNLPIDAGHPNGHTRAHPCVRPSPNAVHLPPSPGTCSPQGHWRDFIITNLPYATDTWFRPKGCTLTLRSRLDHCHWVQILQNGKF